MLRPTKDEYYLGIAKSVSMRSTCLKRRYGAIIVNNDEIVATGYNGSARGETNCCELGYCNRLNKPHNSGDYSDCPAVHAEQNAMLSASRKDMLGGTLYLYGMEREKVEDGDKVGHVWKDVLDIEPCPICSRMLRNAGIKSVVTY